MTGKTILKMENIRKEFPGVVALDDISFDLKEGSGRPAELKSFSSSERESGRYSPGFILPIDISPTEILFRSKIFNPRESHIRLI